MGDLLVSYDVFISHDAKDLAVAEAACAAIERAGHICWMAPRDVAPGEDENGAIVDAIHASRIFLLIVSAGSADSDALRREAERAANAGLAILLFRIEEVEPSAGLAYALGEAHRLDALQPPLAPHLDYLTAIVGRMVEGGGSPSIRPLTAPPQPLPKVAVAMPSWLPIALAGLVGLLAIAIVAAIIGSR